MIFLLTWPAAKQLVIDNKIIKKGIGKIRSLFVFIFNIAIIKLNLTVSGH